MSKTRNRLLALTALGGLAIGGAAVAETVKLPARQVALGVDHFQAKTQVIDDQLDVETVVSTQAGFQTGKGLFRNPSNDNYLRAVVDKRTGATRYEVRQTLMYQGSMREYDTVAYETAAWPVQAQAIKIRDNAGRCFLFEAPELCTEEVAFSISENELRKVAAKPQAWGFKFKSPKGYEHRTAITQAEIVGLLNSVDAYRATLPAVQAQADTATGG
ncbi:hypothetical protein DDF62_23060 [Caulobacter radicis]|uniref:hypothetical protein n=1 Tax=Caulobacter radicis TaxID=2172650 RepID=UPI000D57A0DB|nr:hypothetical protein [Caulobacter radicis]PVM83890.1 hypothetical protein DDF62_23060 [Caulobacter radicis]